MTFAFVRRPGFWAPSLALGALVLGTVIGRGGLLEIRGLLAERRALAEEIFRVLRVNENLREQILTLRRSERHVERLARQKLGLVRDREIVYRFRSGSEEDTSAP